MNETPASPHIQHHAPLLSLYPVAPSDSFPLDFPDAIDMLHAGCVVKVKQPYKREFFGNVVTVDVVEQKVLVEAWNAATPNDWYGVDVVSLIWTKEAAALALELSAETDVLTTSA